MKHWIKLMMLLIFAVILGCGGGGRQTASPGTGAIEGYVWVPAANLARAETGIDPSVTPMLTLGSSQTPPLGYVALVGADITVEIQGQTAKTKTDSTGHFKVSGLPAGTAKVTITPPLIGNTGLGEFLAFTTTMEVKDKTTAYIGSNGNISLISHSADHLNVVVNQIDSSRSPTLDLYVSVIDPTRNTPIIGLGRQNFQIKIAGSTAAITNVRQVESFSAPISVCLVLDRSGSMCGQPFDDLQTAAKQFVDYLDADDKAEVISFSDDPTVDCAFTSDKNQLQTAIDQLSCGGSTALYDACGLAVDNISRESNSRKAAAVITDGGENNSWNFDLKQVISNAKIAGIPFYTIGLGFTRGNQRAQTESSPERPTRAITRTRSPGSPEEDLQRLAQETGGEYFYAPGSSDLMGIYTKISQRQQQMYVVTITDPSPQDSDRTVEVTVSACGLTGVGSASYNSNPLCEADNNRSWDPAAGLQMYTYCTGRPVYHNPNYYDGIGNTGQCTWFVYAVRQDELPTPGQGDAYRWYDVCQYAGYTVGDSPKPGSIAVWNENVAGTGHVALVTKVNPDNTFEVWDSNWRWDQRIRHRLVNSNPPNLTGFIYWKGSDIEP